MQYDEKKGVSGRAAIQKSAGAGIQEKKASNRERERERARRRWWNATTDGAGDGGMVKGRTRQDKAGQAGQAGRAGCIWERGVGNGGHDKTG